ncbi:hypothetical protein HZA39_01350 [Candidatus Peregrinibacteria bacterium]|nr:hypothetical protein [Candidatus Peregrinibacteria bacterium]
MKKIMLLTVFMAFFLPTSAFAASVVSAENIYVKNPTTENLYLSGRDISVDANIIGDFVALGMNIVIDNDIQGDVLAAGTAINISSNIKGSSRMAGAKISINGNVDNDVFVIGGNVDIAKNSVIGGDLIVYAGNVSMDGIVHGNLRGDVNMIKITGSVGKNVILEIEDYVRIAQDSRINGDLIYTSSTIVYVPDGVVGGAIKRNAFAETWLQKGFLGITLGNVLAKFIGFLTFAIIGLLIAFLVPIEFPKVSELMKKSFLKYLGIGFLILIAAPIGCVILLFTVIGVPISLIIAAVALIMGYVSKIFAGFFIGDLILRHETTNKWKLWGRILLGLAIISVVGFVPFAGPLAVFVLWIAAFGAFVTRRYHMLKFLKEKKFW